MRKDFENAANKSGGIHRIKDQKAAYYRHKCEVFRNALSELFMMEYRLLNNAEKCG